MTYLTGLFDLPFVTLETDVKFKFFSFSFRHFLLCKIDVSGGDVLLFTGEKSIINLLYISLPASLLGW